MNAKRYTLLLALIVGFSASASPLDGEWEVVWPCNGATGVYAKRCAEGLRDYFSLELWTAGNSICGFHMATGHLGSRVDDGNLIDGEPTIKGVVDDGGIAKVEFRSAWGATGMATIRVAGSNLDWKILTITEGQSWLPNEAVLLKQSAILKGKRRECSLK